MPTRNPQAAPCYRCGEETIFRIEGIPCCKRCLAHLWELLTPTFYVPREIRNWMEKRAHQQASNPFLEP